MFFLIEENLPIMPAAARDFSSLTEPARPADDPDVGSLTEAGSMYAWGKIPHLPFELVPDQHQ